jgi:hypothetical protein
MQMRLWWPLVGSGGYAFGEILESGGRFCVGAFGSRRDDVFTLIYFVKTFYKCTFNEICKGNAAINCTAVHHKNGSLSLNLMGHTLG